MDAQWWVVWLGVALVCGVVELFSLSLVFAMAAGGALAAAVVAGVTGSASASLLAFVVSTVLLMVVVRPSLLRYAGRGGPASSTGVAALVGRQAEVLRPVTVRDGEVKLAGETWSARAMSPGEALETGSTVYVTRIDGATAVVSPLPPGPLPGVITDTSTGRTALPGANRPSDRPES